MRDSVALLDQLATFGSGAIADEDAVRLLGGLDTALFQTLIAGILTGDSAAVSAAVRRIEDEGWDPRHVYGQFLAFCRDALHLAMGGSPGQVDLPGEEAAGARHHRPRQRLREPAAADEPAADQRADRAPQRHRRAGGRDRLAARRRVAEAHPGGGAPRRLAGRGAAPGARARRAETARRRRRQHRRGAVPPSRRPAPRRPAARQHQRRRHRRPNPSRRRPFGAEPPPPRPTAAPAPTPARTGDPITAFKEEAGKRKQNIGGFLDAAEDIRFEDGRVSVLCPSGDTYLRTPAGRQPRDPGRRRRPRSGVRRPGLISWRAAARPRPPPPEAKTGPVQQVEQIPTVQAVLDIFKGRIETVEEHGSHTED